MITPAIVILAAFAASAMRCPLIMNPVVLSHGARWDSSSEREERLTPFRSITVE